MDRLSAELTWCLFKRPNLKDGNNRVRGLVVVTAHPIAEKDQRQGCGILDDNRWSGHDQVRPYSDWLLLPASTRGGV